MTSEQPRIFIGDTLQQPTPSAVKGEFVPLLGETFYKISNFAAMEPFFISLVSSSDHWLFISTTGGLTAGRVDADQALFPYTTVDKITENSENTGSKAILLVTRAGKTSTWEPFSERTRRIYRTERNLYKNISGSVLVFEEVNLDLDLTYRYAWQTGDRFGFVKTTWVSNRASACQLELVDGIQNLIPASVTALTQNTLSVLLEAYKRSELEPETGLGIFTLSSTLTDLAEPSESLRATTVAQVGLDRPAILLSAAQLDRFREGLGVTPETEVCGRRGAYFIHTRFELDPGSEKTWRLVADVGQDSAAVACLIQLLKKDRAALLQAIDQDLAANIENLNRIVLSGDGLQVTNDRLGTTHHYANVMFNVMRGGIFSNQYWIDPVDFKEFVSVRNHSVLQENQVFFASLPIRINLFDLIGKAEKTGQVDLIRLCYGYLPLTFSRRHGDPSRPWNRFSIRIKKADGSKQLDYEGNWRDIFQNWEALACSYPQYVESMISTFLNATTVDGYNPYRVTRRGVDWEVPEPDNPWSNIGYWSDHQIIYLQKLMEISANVHPGALENLLARPLFTYANVPYQIKPYAELLQDPYNSIQFDHELHSQIESRVEAVGTDGKLVFTADGQVLHSCLAEKLLTLVLGKLANFVPEGGIWMNTQRPEWNDANNALVGKGLSVVTLCYLRRFLAFCIRLLSQSTRDHVLIGPEIQAYTLAAGQILAKHRPLLQGAINDHQRRAVMDDLGRAGSDFRGQVYHHGLSGEQVSMSSSDLVAFFQLVQEFVEHSLRANRRPDGLYHAYNILDTAGHKASIRHLYEMLEGQVAILSSGLLSSQESVSLLKSLRSSALYRPDQHSYILYPDRKLPGFLQKNTIAPERVQGLALVRALEQAQDKSLISKDVNGIYHFNGFIRNAKGVAGILADLSSKPQFTALVEAESNQILALFEETFQHDSFTGRSGTFFAYEGLGSIYWHMVSKLLLAVQEITAIASREPAGPALREAYYDIRSGLGFHKLPALYGAFPTDPYSHTPKNQGAKQPGMSGMVKEEILTRLGELGLSIKQGELHFDFFLLNPDELLVEPAQLAYLDVHERWQHLELEAGSLAYTFCQVPVILQAAPVGTAAITVFWADGSTQVIPGHVLVQEISRSIFRRDGKVRHLVVSK